MKKRPPSKGRKGGKRSPGPEADRLKIKGDWKQALKKAMQTPPPDEQQDQPDTSDDAPSASSE